jgi:CelD/BcsL family acetyltransferase involved in cellulose biosynthesis
MASTSTRVRVSAPSALSSDDRDAWHWHRANDPSLATPFHCLEYAEAAEAAGADVRVAVLERGSERPTFLPYQRDRWNVARPVGLRACDFSGFIGPVEPGWSPDGLLRQCRLSGWRFANVPAQEPALQPFVTSRVGSPYIDLTGGFDAFREGRRAASSDIVAATSRKGRKCERDVGPLRLDVQSFDERAFECLVAWKGEQRNRTMTLDMMRLPWFRAMLNWIHHTDTPHFTGMLSVLYAGDHIAAVHFGMRSGTIWHYWFAAFNRDLGRYSPGVLLLLEMCRAAPALGIDALTLGSGDEPYKARFATGTTPLVDGVVNARLGHHLARQVWRRTREMADTTTAAAVVVRSVRRARRVVFDLTGE